MIAVHVRAEDLRAIVALAERAYPEECCGLLIGRRADDGVVRVATFEAAANVAPPPRHARFEVDPAVRFRAMRRLRGSDLAVVGHYHSHPDAAAEPSEHDREMAFEPDLAWLIVAVARGRATAQAAFAIDPCSRTFRRLSLQTSPDPLDRPGAPTPSPRS